MQSLTILDTEKSGLNKVIISEKGSWNNQEKVWDLFNGFVYDVTNNPISAKGSAFTQIKVKFPKTPLDLAVNSRDPYEMNIIQSQEYIKLLRLLGDEKRASASTSETIFQGFSSVTIRTLARGVNFSSHS